MYNFLEQKCYLKKKIPFKINKIYLLQKPTFKSPKTNISFDKTPTNLNANTQNTDHLHLIKLFPSISLEHYEYAMALFYVLIL